MGLLTGYNINKNDTGTLYGKYSFGNQYERILSTEGIDRIIPFIQGDLKKAGLLNDFEKQRDTSNRGNSHVDGMTNWENSSSDGERFSQQGTNGNRKEKKTLESFNIYSKKKEARIAAKKLTRNKITLS